MELSLDIVDTPRKPRRPYGSWAASLVFHAAILLLLAAITILHPIFLGEEGISAAIGEGVAPPDIRMADSLSSFRAVSHSHSAAPKADTAASRIVSRVTQMPVTPSEQVSELLVASNDVNPSGSTLGEYVGFQLSRVVGGVGNGEGLGANEGAGMFGAPGDSTSFVFVLDRSGSMKAPHFDSGGISRFQRLQIELVKFISQLQPTQSFYVIFFNSDPLPMPAQTLVPATDFNKARYLEWVARLRPEGDTDPRYSLKLATQLHPDQIYFLSDGDVLDRYRKQLLRLEPGNWQLNTFTFGAGFGPFMKSFAEKHHGIYTLVR